MHTLEAKNLAKTIKKTKIVHDISLFVKSRDRRTFRVQTVQEKRLRFIWFVDLLMLQKGKCT